jgi:radical SAM protein with 4Fe4S-binding SPASM domain
MVEYREKNTTPLSSLQTRFSGLVNRPWYDRSRVFAFHAAEFLRCTTPHKLGNLLLAKSQRWLRRVHVSGMPAYYFIDPINVCNLRCPLCPTGRGMLARPRGRMELSLLKRIVDEIAPYAYRVEMYNWGEPFLHPDIIDMIRYVSQRRITVGLSSNLNRLDAEMARQVVESGLTQLIVSIDGATQETYATYRRRGQLDLALGNLELLLKTRQDSGHRTPFIIWRMLVGRHNEHEVEAVKAMAHKMGVDSFLTSALFVDTEDPSQLEEWLPTNQDYSPYDYSAETLENSWHCHDLWESIVINWDGGVAPCCWLHDAEFDFANASDHSIREIWNHPNYKSARRVIGNHTRQSTDESTICHHCRGNPHYMEY